MLYFSTGAKDYQSLFSKEIVLNANNNILEVSLLGDDQQFKLSGLQWEDPAAWGLLFADLARFVAATYEIELGIEKGVAIQRILDGLQIELSSD